MSPKVIRVALSRTIEPQSAVGGWMPRPRKERAEMVRNTKQKRSPNSATSGAAAFGRISRSTSRGRRSPRSRAASM